MEFIFAEEEVKAARPYPHIYAEMHDGKGVLVETVCTTAQAADMLAAVLAMLTKGVIDECAENEDEMERAVKITFGRFKDAYKYHLENALKGGKG